MQNVNNNVLISLSDVTVKFDNRVVLSDINMEVHRGDFIAITGPNGGGKTTLLRVILKLLKPTCGKVAYWNDGVPVDSLPIGYLPQKNMIDSNFPISVYDVVCSGLMRGRGVMAKETVADKESTEIMLGQLGLEQHAKKSLGALSGGQLQRVLLGRALISRPEIIVLDEPLSYVDKQFESQIYGIISEISPTSTILLVSHEMTAIAPMANKHIIVDVVLHNCHASHHFVISECE